MENGGHWLAHRIADSTLHLVRRPRFDRTEASRNRKDRRRGRLRELLGDGPFLQIGAVGEVEEPMLEGYSALNYLAGITQQVKLGTLVTGVHYRYPGILLKTVTTLDVLSGGRAYL